MPPISHLLVLAAFFECVVLKHKVGCFSLSTHTRWEWRSLSVDVRQTEK